MILENLYAFFVFSFMKFLDFLPDVVISLPVGLIEWLTNIINSVSYFLPMSDFLAMFSIWFVFVNFHVIWKLIQRLWDALPFT